MGGSSAAGVLAMLAAAAAAVLLVPDTPGGGSGPRARWPAPVAAPTSRAPAVVGGLVVAIGGVLAAEVPARRWVLVAVLAGAAVLAGRLVRQRRRRLAAAATRSRVLEVCEAVAAELLAGRSPGEALARAAPDWPPLGSVVEAHRLGADVPGALRALAGRPGAEDLATVAAAWQVAHRTGQGLGDAVGRVARDLRAERSLRRIVDGELASARGTARLVAVLPLAALAMGSGAGGHPWRFLLDTPVGLTCLGAGLLLGAAGLAWIEAMAAAVEAGS